MLPLFENLLGPPGVIFLAAILGGVGAFWASSQQERKNTEITKLNQKIVAEQEKFNAGQKEMRADLTEILNQMVADRKIRKEDAQRVLAKVNVTLEATLEDMKADIKGEVKAPLAK